MRLALDLHEIPRGSSAEDRAVVDALLAVERGDFATLVEAAEPKEIVVSDEEWDDFLRRLVEHSLRRA